MVLVELRDKVTGTGRFKKGVKVGDNRKENGEMGNRLQPEGVWALAKAKACMCVCICVAHRERQHVSSVCSQEYPCFPPYLHAAIFKIRSYQHLHFSLASSMK